MSILLVSIKNRITCRRNVTHNNMPHIPHTKLNGFLIIWYSSSLTFFRTHDGLTVVCMQYTWYIRHIRRRLPRSVSVCKSYSYEWPRPPYRSLGTCASTCHASVLCRLLVTVYFFECCTVSSDKKNGTMFRHSREMVSEQVFRCKLHPVVCSARIMRNILNHIDFHGA